MKCEKGFTLLEVLFVTVLMTLLISAILFLYVVILKGWDQIGRRGDVRGEIHFALERMTRDVRSANAVSAANHALRFTICEGSGTCTNNSYIYYLYHASDTWTPAYNQTSYQLRRAPLTGGINGTFTYGSGDLIASGLRPPTAETTITVTSNTANINLVGIDTNETIRIQSYARPRNL